MAMIISFTFDVFVLKQNESYGFCVAPFVAHILLAVFFFFSPVSCSAYICLFVDAVSKILLTEIYFAYYHFFILWFCSFMLCESVMCVCFFFSFLKQFKLHFMQIIVIILMPMKLFFALLGKMCVYTVSAVRALIGWLAFWLKTISVR